MVQAQECGIRPSSYPDTILCPLLPQIWSTALLIKCRADYILPALTECTEMAFLIIGSFVYFFFQSIVWLKGNLSMEKLTA